jgi:hypothetical protein
MMASDWYFKATVASRLLVVNRRPTLPDQLVKKTVFLNKFDQLLLPGPKRRKIIYYPLFNRLFDLVAAPRPSRRENRAAQALMPPFRRIN